MDKGVFAIDPGPERSHWAWLRGTDVIGAASWLNDMLLSYLRHSGSTTVVVEIPYPHGKPMSFATVLTAFWAGRITSRQRSLWLVPRESVKLAVVRSRAASPAEVRQAVIDHFGEARFQRALTCTKCGGKGWRGRDHTPCPVREREPGDLAGVSGDVWDALALAVAWQLHMASPVRGFEATHIAPAAQTASPRLGA